MTISSRQLSDSGRLINIDGSMSFSLQTLKDLLPDMETALFFCKVYDLDYIKMSELIQLLFKSSVLEALTSGDHSVDLQDYLVNTIPVDVMYQAAPQFVEEPPPGEVLPELWDSFKTDIAKSIKEVAEKLKGTIAMLPSKTGSMTFSHMAKLNKQRPTIGVYGAGIHHERVAENLVILDDSGSMSASTVNTILADVISLSWNANAHLVLVSNTARHWDPGAYNIDDVMRSTEFGGTQYETLAPLLNRHWGTVITIADYDSSYGAKDWIRKHATGSIEQVLDISLVDRPTFLSECVGQIANEVRPLLIGNSYRVMY